MRQSPGLARGVPETRMPRAGKDPRHSDGRKGDGGVVHVANRSENFLAENRP